MDEATPVATTVAARPTNSSPTRWSAFKYALFAFALSRYLIIMASALAFAYSEHWPHPEAYPQWLNVFTEDYRARVPALVTQDDATWYLGVAQHGYDKGAFDPHQFKNWAFFPLHPMVWRAALKTGLPPRGYRACSSQISSRFLR